MNEGKVNLIKPKSLSKQNKNHRRSRKFITHHKIENEEGWKKWEERKENKLTSIKKNGVMWWQSNNLQCSRLSLSVLECRLNYVLDYHLKVCAIEGK